MSNTLSSHERLHDNLHVAAHRGDASVWSAPALASDSRPALRVGIGMAGAALVLTAPRGARGRLMAGLGLVVALGAALADPDRLMRAWRWLDASVGRATAASVDPVDEASEESFPASDAPAWTHLKSVGASAPRLR